MHDLERARNTRRFENHTSLRRLDGLSGCLAYGVVVVNRRTTSSRYFFGSRYCFARRITRNHVRHKLSLARCLWLRSGVREHQRNGCLVGQPRCDIYGFGYQETILNDFTLEILFVDIMTLV